MSAAAPRFSVIIPVYNGEEFVGDAIRSVIDQEYPAWEIIVVDDGSTDRTPETLDRFGASIIRIRTENAGASAARNAGMKRATGDYLVFLDHDDLWFRNRLKKQAEYASLYPDIGFFCCDYIFDEIPSGMKKKHFSRLKNSLEMNFGAPLRKSAFELLLKEHFVGTASAAAIRRDVAEKTGPFNPRNKIAQDYEYWLRCAMITNFVVMPEALMHKRRPSSSLSADLLKTYEDHRAVLAHTMRAFGDYIGRNHLWDVSRLEFAKIGYELGNFMFECGQRKKAFLLYFESFWEFRSWRNLRCFLWTVFKKTGRVLVLDPFFPAVRRRHGILAGVSR